MNNNHSLIPEWRTASKRPIRDGIGAALVKIGQDEKVVVLSADLAESTRIGIFAEHYPERFFDVGVAEQNLAGVAAGLAFANFTPFIASYATFSPGRNWEQIRISVALSRANVKIIGGHAGVATGQNGPSHQATEDIAIMRVLPNMTVLVPCDATQAEAMIEAAHAYQGPVYIRACRPETPDFTKPTSYRVGSAQVYREGRDITLFACGIQVYDALIVAEELAQDNIECEVVNVSSIKPLDEKTILTSAKKTGKVVTLEDHQVSGGMGSAVAELLSAQYPVLLKRIGLADQFGISGKWGQVYASVGLDRASLKKAVVDWFHE